MNHGKPGERRFTAADVAEILGHVPSRPAYPEWISVISAVASVLDATEAAAVLAAWSPEETPGEYARKLRSPCKRVGIGSLIATAKLNGFDASAFTRRRVEDSTFRHVAAIPAPAAKKLPRYTVRPGTEAELETLAKLRGLASAEGLDAMQTAGCLAFADDLNDVDAEGTWRPAKSWLILDPTRRNVSARRLDGLPWNCCGRAKSRCLTGPGSKSWPIGLLLAKPGQHLDVVEGEADLLSLWHLHACAKTENAVPVGLMGSCANPDPFASEISSYVLGRIVQIFVHRDANGTGHSAATKWAASFYRLGAASVRTRNLAPWLDEAGKDLNDVLAAANVRRRACTPDGFCPQCFARGIIAAVGGPTCSCVPYRWPVFTSVQISADTIHK